MALPNNRVDSAAMGLVIFGVTGDLAHRKSRKALLSAVARSGLRSQPNEAIPELRQHGTSQ
ncbi:MAG: hypothetical protein M1347_06465 [Chloroflexi bacterium]|nr:hypothetical protein [Chloroflexota bacterium]